MIIKVKYTNHGKACWGGYSLKIGMCDYETFDFKVIQQHLQTSNR